MVRQLALLLSHRSDARADAAEGEDQAAGESGSSSDFFSASSTGSASESSSASYESGSSTSFGSSTSSASMSRSSSSSRPARPVRSLLSLPLRRRSWLRTAQQRCGEACRGRGGHHGGAVDRFGALTGSRRPWTISPVHLLLVVSHPSPHCIALIVKRHKLRRDRSYEARSSVNVDTVQ